MTETVPARARALAAMRDPSFYPHRPQAVEVRETHISLVFLAGERAYKVKKEVRLPFLDYGTLERRRHFCAEEVRLNRRLAPDTYLGVRSIVGTAGGGFALGLDDDPGAIEYAVEMRTLPLEQSLERLARSGPVEPAVIERIARRLAEFHQQAAIAPAHYGGPSDVRSRLDENFATVLPWVGTVIERDVFTAVERFSSAFVLGERELLEQRAAAGRIREGHGDLRAEHIVLEGERVTVYDCIEFDDRLRHVDVASDLAFLYMDLERLGAGELAAALERAYIERCGDAIPPALLAFYACYRAWVRVKTSCLRLEQIDADEAGRASLVADARALSRLARRFAWRARLPLVLVLCGVGASGKSALAEELSHRSGLPRSSSDTIRKGLAGVAESERGGEEIYGEGASLRTYEELARRAREHVERSGGVLIDATFARRRYRQILSDALRGSGARVLFCECVAPEEVLRDRAHRRRRAPERGSDATWEVVREQLARFEPLDEVAPEHHAVLRTDRPLCRSLADLEALVSLRVDGAIVSFRL